ncbi:hypothetical protein OS121_01260 [Mycolicibacterium mucogenicum]|uniref:hypothetical protein n=1 Tax=Mycolicibacterium mucogenicum TaxID=56689 RepID=UPI00076A71B1|nr:hypothetical protein [Mycolicibacterium mucogenicum]MCX8553729.1 hypothetical protein [Mycolicibacterium mucogenicum]TXH25937.1 MAG: hypothetical protein E6R06_08015 [Mycobacterium sp.]
MEFSTLDLATRKFWRATGRAVDLDGRDAWLRAPLGSRGGGNSWLRAEAARRGGALRDDDPDAGLQPDLEGLSGPGFDAAAVHPMIHDFYTQTARWRMEVWSSWSPLFWAGGELISRMFGKRVQQLALPMRPLDVARGIDGRVSVITDGTGAQVAAGWIRTLRGNGDTVFSGCYSRRTLPGADRASVHVTFPLEEGNVQVFLRPQNLPGGGLRLSSPTGPWGADGAYVLVRDRGRYFARRVPVHETFDLYVDGEQVLRTDHVLRMWNMPAVRLHYKLERRGT